MIGKREWRVGDPWEDRPESWKDPKPEVTMADYTSRRVIVEQILAVWAEYPTLRLGQLLSNAIPAGKDLFYVENGELSKYLDEYEKRAGR